MLCSIKFLLLPCSLFSPNLRCCSISEVFLCSPVILVSTPRSPGLSCVPLLHQLHCLRSQPWYKFFSLLKCRLLILGHVSSFLFTYSCFAHSLPLATKIKKMTWRRPPIENSLKILKRGTIKITYLQKQPSKFLDVKIL